NSHAVQHVSGEVGIVKGVGEFAQGTRNALKPVIGFLAGLFHRRILGQSFATRKPLNLAGQGSVARLTHCETYTNAQETEHHSSECFSTVVGSSLRRLGLCSYVSKLKGTQPRSEAPGCIFTTGTDLMLVWA